MFRPWRTNVDNIDDFEEKIKELKSTSYKISLPNNFVRGDHFIPNSLSAKIQFLVRHCLNRVLTHHNVLIYDHYIDILDHVKDAFQMYNVRVVEFNTPDDETSEKWSTEEKEKVEHDIITNFFNENKEAISKQFNKKWTYWRKHRGKNNNDDIDEKIREEVTKLKEYGFEIDDIVANDEIYGSAYEDDVQRGTYSHLIVDVAMETIRDTCIDFLDDPAKTLSEMDKIYNRKEKKKKKKKNDDEEDRVNFMFPNIFNKKDKFKKWAAELIRTLKALKKPITYNRKTLLKLKECITHLKEPLGLFFTVIGMNDFKIETITWKDYYKNNRKVKEKFAVVKRKLENNIYVVDTLGELKERVVTNKMKIDEERSDLKRQWRESRREEKQKKEGQREWFINFKYAWYGLQEVIGAYQRLVYLQCSLEHCEDEDIRKLRQRTVGIEIANRIHLLEKNENSTLFMSKRYGEYNNFGKKIIVKMFSLGILDICLVTDSGSEGTDFKSPRESYMCQIRPYGKYGTIMQFKGRLNRLNSHEMCPKKFKKVTFQAMMFDQNVKLHFKKKKDSSDEEKQKESKMNHWLYLTYFRFLFIPLKGNRAFASMHVMKVDAELESTKDREEDEKVIYKDILKEIDNENICLFCGGGLDDPVKRAQELAKIRKKRGAPSASVKELEKKVRELEKKKALNNAGKALKCKVCGRISKKQFFHFDTTFPPTGYSDITNNDVSINKTFIERRDIIRLNEVQLKSYSWDFVRHALKNRFLVVKNGDCSLITLLRDYYEREQDLVRIAPFTGDRAKFKGINQRQSRIEQGKEENVWIYPKREVKFGEDIILKKWQEKVKETPDGFSNENEKESFYTKLRMGTNQGVLRRFFAQKLLRVKGKRSVGKWGIKALEKYLPARIINDIRISFIRYWLRENNILERLGRKSKVTLDTFSFQPIEEEDINDLKEVLKPVFLGMTGERFNLDFLDFYKKEKRKNEGKRSSKKRLRDVNDDDEDDENVSRKKKSKDDDDDDDDKNDDDINDDDNNDDDNNDDYLLSPAYDNTIYEYDLYDFDSENEVDVYKNNPYNYKTLFF